MTKIRLPGPGGDDQVIVVEFAAIEADQFFIKVDRGDFPQRDVHVFLLPEDFANRCRDIRRIQLARCHLVQQVVISLVDQINLDRFIFKCFDNIDAAKTSSDDNKPWQLRRSTIHSNLNSWYE